MYPNGLTTDRLRLRPLRLDDGPVLHERVTADLRVSRSLTWRPTSSPQEATERIAGILDDEQAGTSRTWSIDPADEPHAPIGMFTVRTTEHGQELGYCLTPDAWGQGLMVEAVTAVTSALLTTPDVMWVWATCDVENHASVRVLERAGFQREGLLRKCAIHPNIGPDHRDCLLYAQIRGGTRPRLPPSRAASRRRPQPRRGVCRPKSICATPSRPRANNRTAVTASAAKRGRGGTVDPWQDGRQREADSGDTRECSGDAEAHEPRPPERSSAAWTSPSPTRPPATQ